VREFDFNNTFRACTLPIASLCVRIQMFKTSALILAIICTGMALVDAGEDPCDPFPCKNEGVCLRRAKTVVSDVEGKKTTTVTRFYTCLCPRGWSGQHCDVEDEICRAKPSIKGKSCLEYKPTCDGGPLSYAYPRTTTSEKKRVQTTDGCVELNYGLPPFKQCSIELGEREAPNTESVFEYYQGASSEVKLCEAAAEDIYSEIWNGEMVFSMYKNGTRCGVVSASPGADGIENGVLYAYGIPRNLFDDVRWGASRAGSGKVMTKLFNGEEPARVCMMLGPFPRGAEGARVRIFDCARLKTGCFK
jgi:hypothetical protein